MREKFNIRKARGNDIVTVKMLEEYLILLTQIYNRISPSDTFWLTGTSKMVAKQSKDRIVMK